MAPHYLAYSSKLAQSIIVHGDGQLKAFGMDLAQTALSHHTSVGKALPYYILIVVMTGSQYWQQRQINQRNPAAANANPQMKMTMQLFPIFYAFISVRIPATVVFYLLLSGLFRMAQNSISYRYDPVLRRAMTPVEGAGDPAPIEAASRPKAAPSGSKAALTPARSSRSATATSAPAAKPGSFMERLRAQAAEAKAQADRAQQAKAASGGRSGPKGSTGGDEEVTPPTPASPASGSAKAGGSGRGAPAKGAAAGKGGAPAKRPAARSPAPEPDEKAVGNGASPPKPGGATPGGASPLRVTRPPGRSTPKGQPGEGRRPRRDQ